MTSRSLKHFDDLAMKADLVSGENFWETKASAAFGLDSLFLSDGPNGIRKQTDATDHLGMASAATSTCYPTTGLAACSWDPELMTRLGAALAADAAQMGVDVVLAPGVNIRRNPLCGRNFEYFSEDPYLTGQLAARTINGLQDAGIGACVKHFACNNQELGRLTLNVEISERALREIYLPAFETCVRDADPWMLMTAYNRVNGEYCTENTHLLKDILRDEWGYKGTVVTDWGGIDDRVAALCLGVDLEMPNSGSFQAAQIIADGADNPDVCQALDGSIKRLSKLSDRHRAGRGTARFPAPHLAREVAAQSIVLLKNDGDVLPVDQSGHLLVVGQQARMPRVQGSGSSKVSTGPIPSFIDVLEATGHRFTFVEDPDALAPGAALARAIEAHQFSGVLVFSGLPEAWESEGRDRKTLDLPPEELGLIEKVAALTSRAVVVLQNGGNVTMPFHHKVAGIVECYLSGEEGMAALADILTGEVNPSGRLTETIYSSFKDCSCHGLYPGHGQIERYSDDIFVGYRFADRHKTDVLFPFGHGLSYTSFKVENMAVDTSAWGQNETVRVTVDLRNTGARAGAETVQLYVSKPDDVLEQAPCELVGFKKIMLEPDEVREVELIVAARSFMSFDPTQEKWVLPGTEFALGIGHSSRQIALSQKLCLEHASRIRPLIDRNTPFGIALRLSPNPDFVRSLMVRFIAESGIDFDLGAPDEQFKWDVVSDFPIRSLVTFTKGKFSLTDLEKALSEITDGSNQNDPVATQTVVS